MSSLLHHVSSTHEEARRLINMLDAAAFHDSSSTTLIIGKLRCSLGRLERALQEIPGLLKQKRREGSLAPAEPGSPLQAFQFEYLHCNRGRSSGLTMLLSDGVDSLEPVVAEQMRSRAARLRRRIVLIAARLSQVHAELERCANDSPARADVHDLELQQAELVQAGSADAIAALHCAIDDWLEARDLGGDGRGILDVIRNHDIAPPGKRSLGLGLLFHIYANSGANADGKWVKDARRELLLCSAVLKYSHAKNWLHRLGYAYALARSVSAAISATLVALLLASWLPGHILAIAVVTAVATMIAIWTDRVVERQTKRWQQPLLLRANRVRKHIHQVAEFRLRSLHLRSSAAYSTAIARLYDSQMTVRREALLHTASRLFGIRHQLECIAAMLSSSTLDNQESGGRSLHRAHGLNAALRNESIRIVRLPGQCSLIEVPSAGLYEQLACKGTSSDCGPGTPEAARPERVQVVDRSASIQTRLRQVFGPPSADHGHVLAVAAQADNFPDSRVVLSVSKETAELAPKLAEMATILLGLDVRMLYLTRADA